MDLHLSPLDKAFESLSKGLTRALQQPEDLEVRDGCIQLAEEAKFLIAELEKRIKPNDSP